MAACPEYEPELLLLHQPSGSASDAVEAQRTHYQYFLRLGKCGSSMEVAYSASKGGVNSFTKALAKELAPSNIQVNAISCGVIDTAMNHCFSPEEMNALREEIPADRLGQPEEVAKLVLQLIQAPTYLTGQILTLDGGWQ